MSQSNDCAVVFRELWKHIHLYTVVPKGPVVKKDKTQKDLMRLKAEEYMSKHKECIIQMINKGKIDYNHGAAYQRDYFRPFVEGHKEHIRRLIKRGPKYEKRIAPDIKDNKDSQKMFGALYTGYKYIFGDLLIKRFGLEKIKKHWKSSEIKPAKFAKAEDYYGDTFGYDDYDQFMAEYVPSHGYIGDYGHVHGATLRDLGDYAPNNYGSFDDQHTDLMSAGLWCLLLFMGALVCYFIICIISVISCFVGYRVKKLLPVKSNQNEDEFV